MSNSTLNSVSNMNKAQLVAFLEMMKVEFSAKAKKADLLELAEKANSELEKAQEVAKEENSSKAEKRAQEEKQVRETTSENEEQRAILRAVAKIRAMLTDETQIHLKKEIASAAHSLCSETTSAGKNILYWTKRVRREHRKMESNGKNARYAITRNDARAMMHSGVAVLKRVESDESTEEKAS